jgi:hypothetical protein
VVIRQRTNKLREVWELLTAMLKERDEKLEEAGDLHRFLKDLDHFQVQIFYKISRKNHLKIRKCPKFEAWVAAFICAINFFLL